MKNWQRTKESFIHNLYSHMLERVTNPNRYFNAEGKRVKYYYGLSICTRAEFLQFALKNSKFNTLFKAYTFSRGSLKLAPSIDRIDNKKGYTLGNMQFLTHSENCGKNKIKTSIFIKHSKTGTIYGFARTITVSKFLSQKGRVNLKHKTFTNLKTGTKFLNVTKKVRA